MPRKITLADGSILNDVPDDATDEQITARADSILGKDYGTSWFIGGHPAKAENGPDGKPVSYAVYERNYPGQLKLRVPATYNTPDIEEYLKIHNPKELDLVKQRENQGFNSPVAQIFKGGYLEEPIKKIVDSVQERYNPGQNPADRALPEIKALGKIVSIAPSLEVGNRVAAQTPLPPVGKLATGTIAGLLTYLGSRKAIDLNDTVMDAAKDLVISEAPTIAASWVASKARGYLMERYGKGAVELLSDRLREVPMTFGQLREVITGKKQNVINLIEKIFATDTRRATQEEAKNVILKKGGDIALGMGPKTPGVASKIVSPSEQALIVQGDLGNQAQKLTNVSNMHYNNAAKLSDQIVQEIPNGSPENAIEVFERVKKLISSDMGYPTNVSSQISGEVNNKIAIAVQAGATLPEALQSVGNEYGPVINTKLTKLAEQMLVPKKQVLGPINANVSLQKAADFVKKYENTAIKLPEEAALYNRSKEFLEQANAKVSDTGALISADPISFKEAWEYKKSLGEHYQVATRQNPNIGKVGRFDRGSFKSIDNDISTSMDGPIWGNIGPEAKDAWRQSKNASGLRSSLFDSDKIAGQILKAGDTPESLIQTLYSNPKLMERALITGEVKLMNGKVVKGVVRQDLQKLKVNKWFTDAVNPTTTDPNGLLDFTHVLKELQDPNFQAANKLLFPEEQRKGYIEAFEGLQKAVGLIRNGAISQEPTNASGNAYFKIVKPVQYGIAIGTGILTGHFSGSSMAGLAGTSVILGGSAMAQLMSKPASAKALVAMINGKRVASDEYVSRLFVNALQGTDAVFSIQDKQGELHPMKVDAKGEVISAKPEDK
jgi:hypothetical protein